MNYIKTKTKVRKVLYGPILYVQLYLAGVLILYILGPLEWRTQNPLLFYAFLFLAQGLLFIGYNLMIKKLQRKEDNLSLNVGKEAIIVSHTVVIKYIKIFITINLIVTIMYLMRNTGMAKFSIRLIVDNLSKGLNDSMAQYLEKFTEQILFGGRWLAPVITLTSPILWPILPLSFVYFGKIGIYNQVLTIFTIFFEAARWVSTGTNKGVIDLILILVFIFFIKIWQKSYEEVENKKSASRKKIVTILIAIVLLILGLAFFANNIGSRLNKNYDTVTLITGNTEVNLNSPIMNLTPNNLQPLMVYATQYLTQGYYGLSLTLDEPFIPMFGVGNSVFLIENFEEVLNRDIYQYTYPVRISHEGWAPFMNWHSAYVWLANDLSFLGVLVLMYFLGKYFAIISYKSIALKDPIAIVLLCMVFLIFFYLPCNNQILSSPLTFMAFWGLNALWIFKTVIRKRSLNNMVWIKQ